MRFAFYLSGFVAPALLMVAGLPEGFARFDSEAIAQGSVVQSTTSTSSDRQNSLLADFKTYQTEGLEFAGEERYEEAIAAFKKASDTAQQYIEAVESSEDTQKAALAAVNTVIPIYEESINALIAEATALKEKGEYESFYQHLDLGDNLAQQNIALALEAVDLVFGTQQESIIQVVNKSAAQAYSLSGAPDYIRAVDFLLKGDDELYLSGLEQSLEQHKSGLPYALKSNDPSILLDSQSAIADRHIWIGYAYSRLGKEAEGIAAATKGLDLIEKTSAKNYALLAMNVLSTIYVQSASSFTAIGEYEQALVQSQHSLDYAERMLLLAEEEIQVAGKDFSSGASLEAFVDSEAERQDWIQKALANNRSALLRISLVYSSQNNYPKALEIDYRRLDIVKRIGDKSEIAATLRLISSAHRNVGDYRAALEAAQEAAIAIEGVEDAGTESALAVAYDDLGRYAEATEAYERALKLAVEAEDAVAQVVISNNLNRILIFQGQYENSFSTLKKSLASIRRIREKALSARTKEELYFACGAGHLLQDDNQSQAQPEGASVAQNASENPVESRQLESGKEQCVQMTWILEYKNISSTGSIYSEQGRFQESLSAHEQALEIAEQWGGPTGVKDVLSAMSKTYFEMGDYDKSSNLSQRALAIARDIGDQAAIAHELNSVGALYSTQGRREKSLAAYTEALEIFRDIGDKPSESSTLGNMGVDSTVRGKFGEADRLLQQALKLSEELGALPKQATQMLNLSSLSQSTQDYDIALQQIEQALAIAKKSGLRPLEGQALRLKGNIHQARGELNEAFDAHTKALEIATILGATNDEAYALADIGSTYDLLGQYDQAIENHHQALSIFESSGDTLGQAVTLTYLGRILSQTGEAEEALSLYEQALSIHQESGNVREESMLLVDIGRLQARSNLSKARAALQRSLDLGEQMGDTSGVANTLSELGRVERKRGRFDEAFSLLQRSLSLFKAVGDRPGEADIQYEIATLYAEQDRLPEALEAVNSAIAQIERLRSGIRASELRTSYFATVQDYYLLKTDLLMKLNQPEAAFQTNEAARARTLIELLNEASVDIRQGADSALLTKEKSLQSELQKLESRRITTLSGEHTPAAEKALDTESDRLLQQLDQVVTHIRSNSPAYAELVAPQPLSMKTAQQVLDPDTVLVQYALGEEQSYLWIVSQDQYQAYTLPSGSSIQTKAQQFRSVLTTKGSQSDIKRSGDALMSLIFPERPEWIEGKRLLIVGDGLLSEIPFAALPLPNQSAYVPLLSEHEILSQPSITAVDVLRKQLSNRPERPSSVAVLADPIYRAEDDNRLSQSIVLRPQAKPSESAAERTLRALDLSAISRLPYTRKEAQSIESLAEANNIKSTIALDFDANFDWITDDSLSQYSTIHLATHGFVNPINPQLSGVVLSLLDEAGNLRDDGFLRLHDIFNLDLSAELVVLSACQTGLGKNVSGEGVIGLSRGFMYAGAERVAVSLWNVDDESTASLIALFYKYMMKDDLSPSAAMRAAQLRRWEAGEMPYRWAAFTLQGEWR